MNEVTVFTRSGCHLCEVVIEELEPLCRAARASMRVLDVDSDPQWRELYGLRVPVVLGGGEELSGAPLDRERVSSWLKLT